VAALVRYLVCSGGRKQSMSSPNAQVRDLIRQLLQDVPPGRLSAQEFLGARFDAGLAWVNFPVGYGGLGLPAELQAEIDSVLRDEGAPMPGSTAMIGHNMAAPALIAFGTDDQRSRHLRATFTGEQVWCQLFSEPGAGSDLASLSTKAIRLAHGWSVRGQKVWSTYAHKAGYGLLVARTDPDKLKHQGLTFFVVDMHSPGLEVRPLRQITGEAEFNEVFLDGVVVPDENRVGEVGDGWHVVTAILANERRAIGTADRSPFHSALPALLDVWREESPQISADDRPIRRDQVVRVWSKAQALRLLEERGKLPQDDRHSGPEGSILKLLTAEVTLAAAELALELLGRKGALYPSGFGFRQPDSIVRYENPQQFFLRSRSVSIGGGTSEIQRNIIAQRVLGLPRTPNPTAGLPWSQMPRQ
jgi:alkylation response protein AidB-like acyl-CoA dehydrogenase